MNNPLPYKFDLGELYNKAFNIKLPEYAILAENEEALVASKYGSSTYRRADAVGRNYFMPVELGGMQLSYPVIRISGSKNIVETQLTERKGSVIEIINQDSYKIYIRGFMINHQGHFPEEDVYNLQQLFELNKSIPIKSVLTDLFLTSDDRVVIKDFNLPEVQGVENVKPYELELISDSVFELEFE